MKLKDYARLLINAVVAISLCGFVLSCGGGGGDSDSGGASGQTGTVTLTVANSSLPADGSSSTTIRAVIRDSSGDAVKHYTEVVFVTTLGQFRNGSTRYTMQTQPPLDKDGWPDPDADPTGIADVQFIAGTTPGAAKITVNSNGVTNSIYVTLTGGVGAIALTAASETIPADGGSAVKVTATVTDPLGGPVNPGTEVSFKTGLGYFGNGAKTFSLKTTDATGVVDVSVIAGVVPGTTYVEAASGNVVQALSLVLTKTDPLYCDISVQADPARIPADGKSQSLITATVIRTRTTADVEVNAAGVPISDVPITFYKITSNAVPEPLPEANLYKGEGTGIEGPFYTYGGLLQFNMTAIPGIDRNPYFIVWLFNPLTGERVLLLSLQEFACDIWDTVWHCETINKEIGASPLPGNYQMEIQTNCAYEIKVVGDIGPAQTGKTVLSFTKTDANGNAFQSYTADWLPGTFSIKAETGDLSNSENALSGEANVTQTPGDPNDIIVKTANDSIYANGKNDTTVTVQVWINGNEAPDGTEVVFSSTIGTITANAFTVDGIVSAKLVAIASATSVDATVTATVGAETGTKTVKFIGVTLANMQATPAAIFANGTDTSQITLSLQNDSGIAIDGETLYFTTTKGALNSASAATSSEGVATVTLTAPTSTGTATITATYGTITTTTTISFEASGSGSITLVASPTSIPADGTSSSVITATIKDSSGAAVPKGTSVTFTTNLGTFSNGFQTYTVITPGETGVVSVSLIAGTTPGSAKITVSSANISQTVYVGIGGDPVTITVAANPTSIPADGSSSSVITATIKDSSGSPVTAGTAITLTTTLGTFQNGTQTITVNTMDDTGIVSTSLMAATTAGTAQVTASASGVTAVVNVVMTGGGGVGSLTVTANPTSITADGSSSSSITATLKDASGNPVTQGTSVTFTTTLGTFSNGSTTYTTSTADETGVVVTSLIAGTTAGTAKVTVSSGGVSQPVNVEFKESGAGGGSPYGENLGLNPTTLNIAGLVSYGLEDIMTTRISDINANNVPDGTPVNYTTDYGGITPSDSTKSDSKGSYATATLTSEVPDPPDGFVTPTTTMTGGADARVLCIAIDPNDNDIIYLGTDGGGIFKTIDGGSNWSQVGVREQGLTNGVVWDIQIDSENTAILYAGTANGIFRSVGSGDNWDRVDKAKEITGESLGNLDTTDADEDGYSDTSYDLTYPSNRIRAKTYVYLNNVETNQYVYVDSDTIKFLVKDLTNGQAITINYTTPRMIPAYYPIRAIALRTDATGAPTTARTLYAGTYGKGIYKSTDSGFSWAAGNSGLSDQDVLSLGIDPTTNATLYAGTQGGGVFKSVNSAGTWASSNSGLPASVINAIAIDPNTTSRIYIGSLQNGVYYSTNSAATWTAPTTNVTSRRVDKIVLDSTANPATEIYAGTFGDGTDPLGGVYKSADSGVTWSRLTALTDNHVLAMGIIGGAPDTLFAGTWGRNFFKSTDGGTTWTSMKGTSPNLLTNQIFATTNVLFSSNTASVAPVQTSTSWQGAGGIEYDNTTGAGAAINRNYIYNSGTATFLFTVQDSNGNPLVSDSTVTASVTEGSLAGDISVTIADTQTHANTYYAVIWTNNLATGITENASGTLTISVTSDNGSTSTSVSRTLVKPVTVNYSPSGPTAGVQVTVTPSGGAETTNGGVAAAASGYTIVHRQGTVFCNYGSSVTYTSGASAATDSILVTDNVTGGTASASYTVP